MFNFVRKLAHSALFVRGLALIASGLGLMLMSNAMADTTSGVTLTQLSTNIDVSVSQMAKVFSDIALIAGIGFIMASFFKFHQHKLNPTQVPLSQGVTLLLIGAGLMLFPTMLPTATNAVFGKNTGIAKVGGSQITTIIGGKNS